MGGVQGNRCRVATWLAIGWCSVWTAGAAAQVAAPAATQAAASSPSPMEKALLAEAEATVKAFNAADATALGGMFIDDGELVDEDGNVTEGRTAITALFKGFFERFPKAVLEMDLTDARSIGDEMVIEEGVRRITADGAAAAAQVRYVAVRVKEGDRWPLAAYREFSDDPLPTPTEMLAPLDWLVGEWVDESPEGKTQISFQWSDDGNYLLGEYNLAVGGQSAGNSVQRIGWDPVEGKLRSWTFDSDGGFSEGEWMATDDGWIVRSEATLPDGTTGSATMVIKPSDADHFVVESTDRIIAGSEEPDFKLVIARKPPAPAGAVPAAPAK
jgi:uncharacterized protein (TIGR02246 family)